MADRIIEMDGVSLIRDGIKILDKLNWTVSSYENWAVIRRNGSGKSFLLRLISANLFPYSQSMEKV